MNDNWKDYWYKVKTSPIERIIEWYKMRYGYRKMLSVLNKGIPGTSLEVGAGKAYLSRLLADKGWNITASDLIIGQSGSYDLLTKETKLDKYLYVDATQLIEFPNKSFDLVFSCGLIEHFNMHDTVKHLVEMKRVGKRAVCFFPICDWKWKLLWKLRGVPQGNNNITPSGVVRFFGIFKYGYIVI